ncbi:O-antigen ligase family protein [Caldicoprobacter algeriensis]|uniref:O-antigen ligase family protein n=1 Tax=Caldicoprobacter algeriensis TaxID=699281 RepID=UPI003B849BF2|nr:O-antigen ligase family protein [Caldicoprobacter algeriensis]
MNCKYRLCYIDVIGTLKNLNLLFLVVVIYSFKIDRLAFLSTRGSIIIACIIFYLLLLNKNNVVINKIHLLWIVSVIVMILSSLISRFQQESLKYTMLFLIGVLYFIYFSNNKELLLNVMKIQKYFSVIFAVFTLLPLLDVTLYYRILELLFDSKSVSEIKSLMIVFNRYVGIGRFAGNNGFILSLGLGIALCEMLTQRKVIHVVYIIIFFISIFLTGSRYAFLASILSMVLVVFFFYHKKTHLSRLTKFILLIVLIFICILLSYCFFPSSIFDRFMNMESIYNRFKLYNLAWELFLQRPILGHGINTFLYYTFYRIDMLEKTYTHNVFLQLLSETGIIGTILIIASFIVTLLSGIVSIKNLKYSEDKHLLITFRFTLYLQFMFLIYFLTGNPIYDYNQLYLYFIFSSYAICSFDRKQARLKNVKYLNFKQKN